MSKIARDGTPVVWVVQQPTAARADLSSAQRYGTVRFLLDADDSPSVAPGPALRKILHALADYRPGDYVAAAIGDQAGILLVGIALERLRHTIDDVLWLRWERERAPNGGRLAGAGFYVPSRIMKV